MRRILASVLVIVALVASIGEIAFAVFSDSATIPGNSISTGAIDIQLNGDGSEQTPLPIIADGLMPGQWTDWQRYLVTNNSNNNVRLYFYVTDVVGDACVKTNIQIKTGPKDGDEFMYNVYKWNINAIKGFNQKEEITGHHRVFDPSMNPDDVAAVRIRAGLDYHANNNQANETCTWTGVFYAIGTNEVPTSSPVSFPTSYTED